MFSYNPDTPRLNLGTVEAAPADCGRCIYNVQSHVTRLSAVRQTLVFQSQSSHAALRCRSNMLQERQASS